jgi:hypothetical protein
MYNCSAPAATLGMQFAGRARWANCIPDISAGDCAREMIASCGWPLDALNKVCYFLLVGIVLCAHVNTQDRDF